MASETWSYVKVSASTVLLCCRSFRKKEENLKEESGFPWIWALSKSPKLGIWEENFQYGAANSEKKKFWKKKNHLIIPLFQLNKQ